MQTPEPPKPAGVKKFPANSRQKDSQQLLRELVEQSRQLPEVPHLTGTQIKALRTTSRKDGGIVVSVARQIAHFISAIWSTLSAPFSGPARVTDRCKNYGHVAPLTWLDGHPKCQECGQPILSQADLRGSSARKNSQ